MLFRPYDYQTRAIEKIESEPAAGLFLDMGLGKTVITLTAIRDLIRDFEVYRVLVIAPLRVAQDTWTREAAKWDHLKGLRISRVLGSADQRRKALRQRADVYVINRENVVWLCEELEVWPFDMVVIDELSSFKNPKAKRFRALRAKLKAADGVRVVGLTGTPSPNGLIDLWAEIYLLDRGERLGKTLTGYRMTYFYPGAHNGNVVYEWLPKKGADKIIARKLSDLCLSMKAEDYIQLPERMENRVIVTLDPDEKKAYAAIERDAVLRLNDGQVTALSAAAVMNKLLQMANGQVYDDDGKALRIHEKKLDALEEIIEVTGKPVLCFYHYRHDLDAIMGRFPDARQLEGPADIDDWNAGKIRLLVAYPASSGFGINLQEGGSTIVWYGLTWSLEEYQQANARIYRQGQKDRVIVHHIIAAGTVDEQVMEALQKKDTSQAALLSCLKERREVYDQ
jgi:SNF2 family DNA or RNA helicase